MHLKIDGVCILTYPQKKHIREAIAERNLILLVYNSLVTKRRGR